jgi:ribosomal protein L24
MTKKEKLHVKIGDTVTVISGFHKNETGEVIRINPKWQDHSKKLILSLNMLSQIPRMKW